MFGTKDAAHNHGDILCTALARKAMGEVTKRVVDRPTPCKTGALSTAIITITCARRGDGTPETINGVPVAP